jgi:amino acid adenylation domain-containing protein/thioester reductase-like protein
VTAHSLAGLAVLPDPARSLSGGQPDPGPFVPVSGMIETQADRRPGHPAVSYADSTLSYRLLDELANGLAAELAERGVRRGDTVPVLLANSLELPVAYLAVLKLGAAFVPMDPGWPAERLRVALAAMPPGLVLAGRAGAGPASDRGDPVHVVAADRITPTAHRPAVRIGATDLIYGIFTSGTTGVPKCAMNNHGGLANRFRFMTRYFAASGDEVVLQNSRHTVDSSVWQLFWPLTVGGHTVLPPDRDFLDLHHTIDTIAAHQVTASDFVSSVFNALVTLVEGAPELLPRLASLRWLIVGSEPVNPYAVRRLTSLLPGLRVTNGYGPTETSIGMAFHPMNVDEGDLVPLGRPIDNCYAAVVDRDLRPVPTGAVGEIAVGGACVGDGYLGRPGLTAEVFVPNPVPARVPGSRLYLTGDLGHMDEQGRLFFDGRKDFQVKVGGARIELGEIQSAAESCAGVWQAEVLVAGAGPDRSLVLIVSCAGSLTQSALREHLRRVLPRTSLPSRYLLLAGMPLTDAGKVDRGALAALLDKRLAADAARLTSGTPAVSLADRVLQAMRTALGRPELTAQEHFMDAGGDSLRALSVVNTIRAEFGVQQLCAQDLFDHPTAQRLALVVSTYQADASVVTSEAELMEQDSAVPPGGPIPGAPPAGAYRVALVTGASGFVGTRLVHELLTRTGMQVVCLTRAGDDARATQRVAGAMAGRGLWEPAFAGRVRGFAADLSLPGLGLGEATWHLLANTCDVVLHSGALVNFLYDYRAHRRTNVVGTAEVLRLATSGQPVPLYHISTLAALEAASAGEAAPLGEDCEPAQVGVPPGGYNRSKWVAERYLREATRRGATVTLLRLGEVMPATDDGVPNAMALTHLLLSAFYRLRMRPDAELRTDYTPVDYAARRIVAAATDPAVHGQILHVFRPGSIRLDELLPMAGEPLETVPCRRFVAAVTEAASRTGDRQLVLLRGLLPDPAGAGEPEFRAAFAELLTDNAARYRNDLSRQAEDRWRLADTAVDGSLAGAMATYLHQLRQQYPVRLAAAAPARSHHRPAG